MTSPQQDELNRLALGHASLAVREDPQGGLSIIVDCFDQALPERCCVCGLEGEDHVQVDLGHRFRVALPVATFRVMPSGARFDITPEDRYLEIPQVVA